jgi:ribonuclease P protein component
VRNRLRRQLRAILRGLDASVARGWDVLLVVRVAAAGAAQRELEMALVKLMSVAGLIESPPLTSGARGS